MYFNFTFTIAKVNMIVFVAGSKRDGMVKLGNLYQVLKGAIAEPQEVLVGTNKRICPGYSSRKEEVSFTQKAIIQEEFIGAREHSAEGVSKERKSPTLPPSTFSSSPLAKLHLNPESLNPLM